MTAANGGWIACAIPGGRFRACHRRPGAVGEARRIPALTTLTCKAMAGTTRCRWERGATGPTTARQPR
ncbi:hypothetical protein BJ999_005210 [Actinomadura citrea]|uniref:Uncharacterized protein n=1 Tax=Actinomadura citrea TaxID=46158 RepID=A0A7Y9GE95_9ACTN|nr:hypothetical protein [Actinomadura citrea]